MEVYEQQVASNPSRALRMDAIERDMQNWIDANAHRRGSAVITIPVVFHIVHNGQAIGTGPNITDAQVLSQLDVLNEDFRRLNADTGNTPSSFQPVAADIEIEFCLATYDPAGQTTAGINRYNGGQNSWSTNDIDVNLKPATVWNRDNYLNIWSVNFTSSTLLGYAQFPGSPASTDGIVVGYEYVGRAPDNPFNNDFNLGRTATHEVGHWLNLFHIWGDDGSACTGSDQVGDTPNQAGSNSGCPNFPSVSCSNGPNGDMFMNYMDYTHDDCMNIFTAGQKTRMLAAVNTSRTSILSSPACLPQQTFSFSGTVIDSVSGAGIANAQVFFDGRFDIHATTDSNGNFSIATFHEDEYDVYAGAWGWVTKLKADLSIDSLTPPIVIKLHRGYYDDFFNGFTDFGWNAAFTAPRGRWVRGEPIGTTNSGQPVNPGADVPNDFGSECIVTGNGGGAAGNDDVDDGWVELTSPAMDLTAFADPHISFYRWFHNSSGNGNPNDALIVSITNGIERDTLEIVDVNSPNLSQWVLREFKISDFLTPTDSVRIIFYTSDLPGSGHLVEAALDMFVVRDLVLPQALFSVSDTLPCQGSAVAFTDMSLNGPNLTEWIFPGGTPASSSASNPVITYANAGTYDVTLIVTNLGFSDTLTKSAFITVVPKPVLAMSRTTVLCNGGSDGTATVHITSGSPPFSILWSTFQTDTTIINLSAGEYSVTVTDWNSCSANATVFVTQPPVLSATVSTTPDNGQQNGSATVISSGGTMPHSYSWNDPSSQTTQTATGLAAGLYMVTVTDGNGCMKTAIATVDQAVGLSTKADNKIIVYPNPSSGEFIINGLTGDSLKIMIRNPLGQLIMQQSVANLRGGLTVNLGDIPVGVYFMTIESEEGLSSFKLQLIK